VAISVVHMKGMLLLHRDTPWLSL